jgi:hypothetical protein
MERRNRPRRGRDNIYFGAFLGLVFPALGFLLYWLFFFSDAKTLKEYWDFLFAEKVMSAALSLSITLNLAIFFYSLSQNNYETVKGVVGSTILYGLLIIIFKFL